MLTGSLFIKIWKKSKGSLKRLRNKRVSIENSFKKAERLTSKITLEKVFEKGLVLKKYPFLLRYLAYDFLDESKLKIVISVPKRKVKKAVKRNRIRRQLKEIYRINNSELKALTNQLPNGLALFLIYTGEEKVAFQLLEEKLKVLLVELVRTLETNYIKNENK